MTETQGRENKKGSFEHVLVGSDGSADADAAVRIAGGFAQTMGSKVTLVHVVAPPTGYAYGAYPMPEVSEEALQASAEAILKAAAQPLEELGIDFDTAILRGAAADAILDYAEREHVDAIVVGHRGLGAVGRFFMGSVSNKIVHKADCAVLVAPVIEADETAS